MKRRSDPFKLVTTRSGAKVWYADFCDAPLARTLGKASSRIVFSLGLGEGASFHRVSREFDKRLDELKNPHMHTSIDAAVERFISLKQKSHHLDKSTVKEYERVAGHFSELCKSLAITHTSQLTSEIVAQYAGVKTEDGRKPAGIYSDLVQIGSMFKKWHEWRYLHGYNNKAWFDETRRQLRSLMQEDPRRWRIVRDDEITSLLSDKSFADIFTWLLLCGQRVGAVLRLRRQDVAEGIVTYPPSKKHVHRQRMNADMIEFLQTHKPRSKRGFLFWRDKWGDPFSPKDLSKAITIVNHRLQRRLSMTVYNDEYGQIRDDLRAKLNRSPKHHEIIKELDLPHTHNLRATTATKLLDEGVPTVRVETWIGWKTDMLRRVYDRRKPEDIDMPGILGTTSNITSIRSK